MTDERSRLARLEEQSKDHDRRLADAEGEQDAIRRLERTVAGLQSDVRNLGATAESERELQVRERDVNRAFRAEVRTHFERSHKAHETQGNPTVKGIIATVLAVAGAIGVPIATALILAPR